MKKSTLRSAVVAVVILAVYNLIAFVVPFARTGAFWISYGFTLAGLVLVGASLYFSLMKNPDATSRFYNFPIARIGVIYGVLQLGVSLLVMALSAWIAWWIPLLVYAVGLGLVMIALVSVETVVEEIREQDGKLKTDISSTQQQTL